MRSLIHKSVPLLLLLNHNFLLSLAQDTKADETSILPVPSTASKYTTLTSTATLSPTPLSSVHSTVSLSTSLPATSTASSTAAVATDANAADGSASSSGSYVDSDAGAEGDDTGSFQISSGAIGAICGVVGLVVIFGVISTILFVIAKRNELSMRQSLKYTSKRVIHAMTPTSSRFPRNATRAPPPYQSSSSTRFDNSRFGRQARRPSALGARHGDVRLVSPDRFTAAGAREKRERERERDGRGRGIGGEGEGKLRGGLRIDTRGSGDVEKGEAGAEAGKKGVIGRTLGRLWK